MAPRHDPGRLVRLVTVDDGFEAKLIAARLGAAGLLWELRGGVDSMYPIGPAHVYVPETDLDEARELLLADQVEAAFAEAGDDADDWAPHRSSVALWVVVVAVVAVSALGLVRAVTMPMPAPPPANVAD